MSSVAQAREVAARIWRGELPHPRAALAGLHDERAVRARLDALVHRACLAGLDLGALSEVDVLAADPRAVLEATERAVDAALPAYYPSWTSLLDALSPHTAPIVELLMVQSVAARQGRWVVRELELADARTARDLIAAPGPPARLGELVESARAAYQAERPEEAVALLVEADAIERSPTVLLQLAVALWRAGRIVHALHAVRACLLEETERFASPESLLSAARVESSLRRVVDARGAMGPSDEAGLATLAALLSDKKLRTSWRPRSA